MFRGQLGFYDLLDKASALREMSLAPCDGSGSNGRTSKQLSEDHRPILGKCWLWDESGNVMREAGSPVSKTDLLGKARPKETPMPSNEIARNVSIDGCCQPTGSNREPLDVSIHRGKPFSEFDLPKSFYGIDIDEIERQAGPPTTTIANCFGSFENGASSGVLIGQCAWTQSDDDFLLGRNERKSIDRLVNIPEECLFPEEVKQHRSDSLNDPLIPQDLVDKEETSLVTTDVATKIRVEDSAVDTLHLMPKLKARCSDDFTIPEDNETLMNPSVETLDRCEVASSIQRCATEASTWFLTARIDNKDCWASCRHLHHQNIAKAEGLQGRPPEGSQCAN